MWAMTMPRNHETAVGGINPTRQPKSTCATPIKRTHRRSCSRSDSTSSCICNLLKATSEYTGGSESPLRLVGVERGVEKALGDSPKWFGLAHPCLDERRVDREVAVTVLAHE